MGQLASKLKEDTAMARKGKGQPGKRKIEDVDVNWPGHELEKRRKLEAAEPYNDAGVRPKAKEIGLEKVMSSSVSEMSKVSQNVTPRELSSSGDESSEFVSANEDGGVAVPQELRKAGGTEDELESDRSSDDEADEEEEQDPPEAAPKPDVIGQILVDADEHVERLMKGYSSAPSRSQEQEEEEETSESEDDDENSDGDMAKGDDTQVVQDSMATGGSAGLATPSVDQDSGHGSMEDFEAEVDSDEQNVETAPVSADESPASGSQERMGAVEETIRQIKAERSVGGAAKGDAAMKEVGERGAKPEIGKDVTGVCNDEAHKQHVAERKASNKVCLAHDRQQRKASADHGVKKVASAKAIRKSTTTTPRKHKGTTFKPKLHTRPERRAAKRAKKVAEMQRAAREDPASYIQMLRGKVVVVPRLQEDADESARQDHQLAMKKSKRAEFKLQQFEEMVAEMAQKARTNEGYSGLGVRDERF